MSWGMIYDLTTGERLGTAHFKLDDAVYAAQGRGWLPYPDDFNPTGMMVDVTQNPPVFIPEPPMPSPAPEP